MKRLTWVLFVANFALVVAGLALGSWMTAFCNAMVAGCLGVTILLMRRQ